MKDAGGASYVERGRLLRLLFRSFRCPSDSSGSVGQGRYGTREWLGRWPDDTFGKFGGTNYKGCVGSDWNWGRFSSNPMGGTPNGLDGGNGIFVRDENVRTANPKGRT